MAQLSMFPSGVEAMNVAVHRDALGGWCLRVGLRFEGSRWTDVTWEQYDNLSMAEVLEVIDASVARQL